MQSLVAAVVGADAGWSSRRRDRGEWQYVHVVGGGEGKAAVAAAATHAIRPQYSHSLRPADSTPILLLLAPSRGHKVVVMTTNIACLPLLQPLLGGWDMGRFRGGG